MKNMTVNNKYLTHTHKKKKKKKSRNIVFFIVIPVKCESKLIELVLALNRHEQFSTIIQINQLV